MGIYTLKKEDISPLLKGLTVYGTGGGGEPEFGQVILDNEFAQGRDCRVIDLQDVEDDSRGTGGGAFGMQRRDHGQREGSGECRLF